MQDDSAPDIAITPFGSGAPQACLLPSPMPALEARLYEKIRTLHCDRKRESHACHGRVTLDRNGMTLQCPLCGDHRSVYPRLAGDGTEAKPNG